MRNANVLIDAIDQGQVNDGDLLDGAKEALLALEGAGHDWSPPPAHIMPDVVAELGRLAAFSNRPFPKESLIDVPFGSIRVRWTIRMSSADADRVLTPIEE